MKSDEILRFAMILSNGQAETFKRNLTKLIKYVLFEASPKAETESEIVTHIKRNFSINFTENEVRDVLIENHRGYFVKRKQERNPSVSEYTIIPEEVEKIKKSVENNSLKTVINKFVENELKDENVSEENICDLLQKYFYNIFNRDVKTLLTMMNHNEIPQKEENEEFSECEKTLINSFLAWDDTEKNKVVYDIVSSCFEFCMMTTKKDNSSFKHIFNGKVFYLDANIIIRLAGFHNDARKEVIESFIRKCNEAGISIKYTNFTKLEIDAVIETQINNIKQMTRGQKPIDYNALKLLTPAYDNLDFYLQYIEWIKETNNNYNNFTELKKYFLRKIQNVVEQFGFESFEKYATKGKVADNYFNIAVNSLIEYKKDNYANFNIESAKVDIENYLHIYDKDKDIKSNSFLEKKNYFITADHYLLNWARDRVPGVVPTVLLPSDWYSIILKYLGRTDDDYKAFVQFLKLPISGYDEKGENKEAILASVLNLNDSTEVKELVIYDINERLQNGVRVEVVEDFVEESHRHVTKAEVDKAVKNIKEELETKIEEISATGQEARGIGYAEGKEKGIQEGQESVYREIAKKTANRNKKILNGLDGAKIIFIFFALVCFIINIFCGNITEINLRSVEISGTVIFAMLSVLIQVFKNIFQRNSILCLDEEKIYNTLKDKQLK